MKMFSYSLGSTNTWFLNQHSSSFWCTRKQDLLFWKQFLIVPAACKNMKVYAELTSPFFLPSLFFFLSPSSAQLFVCLSLSLILSYLVKRNWSEGGLKHRVLKLEPFTFQRNVFSSVLWCVCLASFALEHVCLLCQWELVWSLEVWRVRKGGSEKGITPGSLNQCYRNRDFKLFIHSFVLFSYWAPTICKELRWALRDARSGLLLWATMS